MTTPTTVTTGLKKVSLASFAKKKEGTAYPAFHDPEASLIAARIIERTEQFNALESALKTDKAELKAMTSLFYFQQGHGHGEVPSSVSVPSIEGEVLVCFQNRYSTLASEAPLIPLVEDVSKYFRQSFELKIDGDKLPPDSAEELVAKLQVLFAEYGASDAITVKDGIKPKADFHVRRHLDLTPEQNMALEQACPIIAMCKTKGRK
jgi:hypothetical protein